MKPLNRTAPGVNLLLRDIRRRVHPAYFQYAHEADPEAELYYNDYGMDGKAKRDKVVELVKMLKDRGLRIDAVGMQGHMGMDYPSVSEFEASILAFAAAE